MHRRLMLAVWLLALGMAIPTRAAAAPVFAKTFGGHIASNTLELTLATNPPCDQTAAAVPNGSRLISDRFVVRVDNDGRGVFGGPVRLVRPDGSLILEAQIQGTIGMGEGPDPTTTPCRNPGHLDGWISRPMMATVSSTNVTTLEPVIPQIRFTADLIPEAAGPTPTYKGTLLGLLEAPAPKPSVTVSTDKPGYTPQQVITFSVRNNGQDALFAMNGRSYCTIIQMERRTATGWAPVGTCNSLVAMRPAPLPAGETVKVQIPAEDGRPAGEYRGSVTVVQINPDDSIKPLAVFYSPIFRVQSPTGGLLITPSQRSYGPRQPIVAIIRNGATPSRVYDGESFCTIVQLQRRDGDNWTEVAPCPLDRATMPTDLKPGQLLRVPLPPGPTTAAPNWIPGRYRLAVTYQPLDANGAPMGDALLAVSEPFPVGNVMVPLGRAHDRG